jgi:hypothetical protein
MRCLGIALDAVTSLVSLAQAHLASRPPARASPLKPQNKRCVTPSKGVWVGGARILPYGTLVDAKLVV